MSERELITEIKSRFRFTRSDLKTMPDYELELIYSQLKKIDKNTIKKVVFDYLNGDLQPIKKTFPRKTKETSTMKGIKSGHLII